MMSQRDRRFQPPACAWRPLESSQALEILKPKGDIPDTSAQQPGSEFFALMRTIQLPENFMSARPMNALPREAKPREDD